MLTNAVAVVASMVSGLGTAIFKSIVGREPSIKRTKTSRETEAIIYNSEISSSLGYDFIGSEAQLGKSNGEHYGDKGRGEVSFVGERRNVIDICRTNIDGKYELRLRRYSYRGHSDYDMLPRDLTVGGERIIRISCEAKVTSDPHTLGFIFRTKSGDWVVKRQPRITVSDTHWTPFEVHLQIDPSRDSHLRIDDHYKAGPTPSHIQIRRIVVAELNTRGA